MDSENPYQSPGTASVPHDSQLPDLSFPTDKCPNCNTRVTLWMGIRQPTPWRFMCTRCRAICRITVPSPWRLLLDIPIFAALTVLTGVAFLWLGALAGGLCILFMVIAWLVDELLAHRYISRYGRFVPIYPVQDGEHGDFHDDEYASSNKY